MDRLPPRVFVWLSLSGAVLALLSTSTPARADDACTPVINAMTKVTLTAYHAYETETAALRNNTPKSSEVISMGGRRGTIFVMVKAKWIRGKVTPEEMLQQQEENWRTTTVSCRHLRDESVNGEAAAVYSTHTKIDTDDTSDATIWISKNKGLPLREEEDLNAGASSGKVHKSMRYEYANVRAPAGIE